MFSKKRVLSHNNDISYSNYNSNLIGTTILKTIKQSFNTIESENKVIDKFKSYNEFLKINGAYYKYYTCHPNTNIDPDTNTNSNCVIKPTFNLYDANISFVDLIDSNSNINSCKQMNNILYPNILNKDINKPNLMFPSHINLNNWCNQNSKNDTCFLDDNLYNNTIVSNNDQPCNLTHYSNKCNCKKAKPLFI